MSSILSFANTSVDDWFGFKRHIFDFEGYEAWLVEAEKKAPGMPWTWCMEWPSAFVKRIGVPDLLARGFHHVHIKVPGYACDEALRVFRRYHDFLHSLGLAERARLIGLSLGGLYSLRYAASNPGMIDRIYVDAPVCSFRNFPRMRRYSGAPVVSVPSNSMRSDPAPNRPRLFLMILNGNSPQG